MVLVSASKISIIQLVALACNSIPNANIKPGSKIYIVQILQPDFATWQQINSTTIWCINHCKLLPSTSHCYSCRFSKTHVPTNDTITKN